MSLSHQPRKRFGQNFLQDDGIIRRIVRSIHPQASDSLVEIGPGQGAITAQLLESCPSLNVIELDRDLVPLLLAKFVARYPEFRIHQCDALRFDFSSLVKDNEPLRVVGNLPYNISTPLIFHLLSYGHLIKDMHFMLQKEVVQRMASAVGEKSYGKLSVMTQYRCRVENLFEVPPECFFPRPKVDSAIVRLIPHDSLPVTAKDEKLLATLVSTAFQQRRKTLRNALKNSPASVSHMEAAGIDPSCRPEQVSVERYVSLSNQVADDEEHPNA